MKICSVCGTKNNDAAITCANFNCRRVLPEKVGFFTHTISFFNRSSNLFTIIASICTILSLSPIFLTFILGENWFNLLLANPIGFESLKWILIATIFGASFVYYLLALIVIDFISQSRNNPDLNFGEFLFGLVILLIGVISVFGLVLFLLLVWFTKLDLIIFYYGFNLIFLAMGTGFIIFLSGIIMIYPRNCLCVFKHLSVFFREVSYQILKTRVSIFIFSILDSKEKTLKIIVCCLLIVAMILMLYVIIALWILPISNNISQVNQNMTQYYSNKTVITKIQYAALNKTKATPAILSLKSNLDAYFTKNWTDFDENYAQCRWSTNYGYFLAVNSDESQIERSQVLLIPKCPKNNDTILWTYDLSDYNKQKPMVIISLRVEDKNKILKGDNSGILGKAHQNFSWSDLDSLNTTFSNISYETENVLI